MIVTFSPARSGEEGREGNGDCDGKGECCCGARVKRKSFASICQNERWLTKVSDQPEGNLTSVSVPTQESSLVIRPIRSNFGKVFFPLKMPSLLIFILQSNFGLPASGVKEDASVRSCGLGRSL